MPEQPSSENNVPDPVSTDHPPAHEASPAAIFPPADEAKKSSPWKKIIIVLVMLAALVAVYALNPSSRSYAMNTIDAIRDKIGALLNPEPKRDLDLLAIASAHYQNRDWEEAEEAYTRFIMDEPDNHGVWTRLADCRHHLEDYAGAIEANLNAADSPRYAPTVLYNLACEYALTGQTDEAFAALESAFHMGFGNMNQVESDADLESLRDDDRFVLPPSPQRMTFSHSQGETIEYWLVLPRDFDPENTYPCLLGLNGGNQTMRVGRGGLNNFWGLQSYYHGWIVVTPAPPDGKAYYVGDGHLLLEEFLDFVQNEYSIEGGKFHVAGYSNGGTSAFRVATEFPDRFHSVTGFPGYATPGQIGHGRPSREFTRLELLQGVKVTMFWGENDLGPSEDFSLKTHERLTGLGLDSTIREFEDEPHIPWSLLGDSFMRHMETLRGG